MKNPVAKNARKFSKAAVFRDRKKTTKKGYLKHKGRLKDRPFCGGNEPAPGQAEHFNAENYLKTPEDIVAYLDAALEDGGERVLLLALRQVANASGGMGKLAKASELNRESLYKTLSERGNPRLETVSAILKTMGLRLSVAPHH